MKGENLTGWQKKKKEFFTIEGHIMIYDIF